MEIDELKKIWVSLDQQIGKQNIVKENILKEVILAKSDKALSRLLNFDIFGLVLTIAVIPFLLFVLSQDVLKPEILRILLWFFIAYMIIDLVPMIWRMVLLSKVDFSKDVAGNIKNIQRYNVFIRVEKTITFVVIMPILIFYLVFPVFSMNLELWRAGALIGACLVTILFAYWQYKRVYDKNISSMLKSLEELRDLKEE
ncbi:hypothetical protein D0T49_00700 [Paludibacter sp. 221]|uniref:hypothetical protein n=1 Tax=Paludibacter sp. 221 TaxID=2302939 RepID=UPI0013D7F58A|nr:hypothetical protein [Paludibacter sp. 221]NDV45572.1 hypothetical protein [Paludibacter sp. 221]